MTHLFYFALTFDSIFLTELIREHFQGYEDWWYIFNHFSGFMIQCIATQNKASNFQPSHQQHYKIMSVHMANNILYSNHFDVAAQTAHYITGVFEKPGQWTMDSGQWTIASLTTTA
jgi:hypothetical protein